MLLGTCVRLLFVLRGANLQLTTDQAFTRLGDFTAYKITSIDSVLKTGAPTVACAGGIYDAASKGGNAVVAAAQSWVTLASGVNVAPTIAVSGATTQPGNKLWFALTTASTAAATADIFVYGSVND